MSGRSLAHGFGLMVLAAFPVGGCSGSSSESPWPVEPNEIEQGPAGEERESTLDLRKLPNRYPRRGSTAPTATERPTDSTSAPSAAENGAAP